MSAHVDRTLVVAIGSSHGDDQAAWHVADLLASILPVDVPVRKASVPLNMIDWLDEIDQLYIIDACEGGGDCADLLRIRWPADLESMFRAAGTHDFDVPAVLYLAESLNRLPPYITLWGIVGESFAPHDEISDVIKIQLPSIAQAIGKEVNDARAITGAVATESS